MRRPTQEFRQNPVDDGPHPHHPGTKKTPFLFCRIFAVFDSKLYQNKKIHPSTFIPFSFARPHPFRFSPAEWPGSRQASASLPRASAPPQAAKKSPAILPIVSLAWRTMNSECPPGSESAVRKARQGRARLAQVLCFQEFALEIPENKGTYGRSLPPAH
jgi:hypothetical protein